ncbi:MAG: hypothetical protein JXA67_15510 [Micromonosporaceae bacterium]|nr:hypothetical protein [Micromonosporaceae bacterium]
MGSVNPAGSAPVTLTAHPLQRCGAWAIAVLAERAEPGDVSPADLDAVAARLVEDVLAASCLPKNASSPDWWKVLFALYPNAKATHASRSRDAQVLRPEVSDLFAPEEGSVPGLPCTFCSAPASRRWAKSNLPMFDSNKALNTLPPGLDGWPLCRGCRVAMWALPYGAWVTLGSATVLMCGNPEVERAFVERNVRRARRIQQLGMTGVPADACAETVTLAALRSVAGDVPVDAVLWSFKNDNQEPWLRVTGTRQAVGSLLSRIESHPALRDGWRRLRRALGRRDKRVGGYSAIARTLFNEEQQRADRLLQVLRKEFATPPKDPAAVDGWRRLARAYQEEMYGMDVERLVPARQLLATWILSERNPRGRFNEYDKVATRPYDLAALLKGAAARLLRDGHNPPDITGVLPTLLSAGPDGWRLRAQLFFEVVAELVAAKAAIGARPDDEDPDDATVDATDTAVGHTDDATDGESERLEFEPDEEGAYA